MSVPFDPDWTVHPSAQLREFVDHLAEQLRDDPAAAISRRSLAGVTPERAKQLLDGTGKPWSLVEAADIGMMFGPNAASDD